LSEPVVNYIILFGCLLRIMISVYIKAKKKFDSQCIQMHAAQCYAVSVVF